MSGCLGTCYAKASTQGPFGQPQVMGDKWRNCRDDCGGQGSAAVDINLLTIHSLLILGVDAKVFLLGTEDTLLDSITLESEQNKE